MGEIFCWAVAGFLRQSAVAGGWPSGLAVAPKVASAPRGPGPGTLAGCLAQSLPQAPQKKRVALHLLLIQSNRSLPCAFNA
jgi:hypothetical protein